LDHAIARAGSMNEQEQLARALVYKGLASTELHLVAEAYAAYDDVLAQFGGSAAQELRTQVAPGALDIVADASLLRANVLHDAGDLDAALLAWDEVVSDFDSETSLAVRHSVANALASKAHAFERRKRWRDEIGVEDALIDRFSGDADSHLRLRVCRALVLKGVALEHDGRQAEACEAYRRLLDEYATGEAADIDEAVAWARRRVSALGCR
jgi:tetratricopeptide (TPR) repeat protein